MDGNIQPLRARIRLNLPNPKAAENTLELYNGTGWHTAAYASMAVLEEIEPVIIEEARREIAEGKGKRPCAYLEGRLRSWSGRLRENAPTALKEQIAPLRVSEERLFNTHYHPQDATHPRIGFNPRKTRCFYSCDAEGKPVRAFLNAGKLVATHWDYAVSTPGLRPMEKMDWASDAVADVQSTQNDHQKGIDRTKAHIRELEKSARSR